MYSSSYRFPNIATITEFLNSSPVKASISRAELTHQADDALPKPSMLEELKFGFHELLSSKNVFPRDLEESLEFRVTQTHMSCSQNS